MLLQSFDITNSRGSVLNFPIGDTTDDGLFVKNIDGLDPVKANLVSSSFANMDGEQFHSSRRVPRNIKVQLGLDPDYATTTVKALRDQLYTFFMPKSPVTFTFHMFDQFAVSEFLQNLDVDIPGIVESFDAPLFTKDPGADISVMCYNPDFYDPNEVIFAGNTTADATESVLSYVGSVETGVTFILSPNRAINEFTIYQRLPDNTLQSIDVSYPMLAGDVLKIVSIFGSKSVVLTRAGVDTSIVWAVSPQSPWLELQPGNNNIRVYAVGAAIPYTIEYTNKYGGL